MNKGFGIRWGTRVKEFGERLAHVKVFNVPLFRWCCGPFIRLGIVIRDGSFVA